MPRLKEKMPPKEWKQVPKRLVQGGPAAHILLILFSFLLAGQATAQDGSRLSAADTVRIVRVEGTNTVDDALVLQSFGHMEGKRYSIDAVRRGIRRIYQLGLFGDIEVQGEKRDGAIELTITVVELPRVGAVEFAGMNKFKKDDALEFTGVLVGELADDRLISRVHRRMREAYENEGFSDIQVEARYLPGGSSVRRIMLIQLNESEKMRIEDIRFKGLRRVQAKKLRGAMKQGTTGFLRGGVYRPQNVEDDMERIRYRLETLGYRDGEVLGYELLPGSKETHLLLEIEVEEGQRYYFGSVQWDGNEKVTTPALYKGTALKSGDVFNIEDIEKTKANIQQLYMEIGHLRSYVATDFAAQDSIVDVSFTILEGGASFINDIIITGNTRTKEKVIRRQMALAPGVLFRNSTLQRSQNELMQLGLFSNLGVVPRSIPGSDDLDLEIEVEERQVGNASAGFGFSSAVGLTGFMELGHPNLFGNGQSVNIRLERGSSQSNAEISFTEPWFRGTPTSVGADLYSFSRIFRSQTVDLNVRRTGGALRLGRQLPLPYMRLFATYRAEQQTTIDEAEAGSNESILGFRINEKDVFTSSLGLRITRNSTNHHLYPTLGSNGSLRFDMAGGPMGGDQVYQKIEFDVKKYLPLKVAGWGPTLMIRPRVGGVSSLFTDKDYVSELLIDESIPEGAIVDSLITPGGTILLPVPRHYQEYEPEVRQFFRLGGIYYDPLRGYEDGEIIPIENRTQRYRVFSATDSLGVTDYDVLTEDIYYPGGRFMVAFTTELQFPIADPLHALLLFDAGGTWNEVSDFKLDEMRRSIGFGLRMEVPILGIIGFDYAYGFDRLDRRLGTYTLGGWKPHFQFGRLF